MGNRDKVVLDFNSPECTFKLKDVSMYDSKTIVKNIEKYLNFNNETLLSRDFDAVYKTTMFQINLMGEDTNNVENLLFVYNLISTQLSKEKRHMLNEKQFKHELKRKGYSFKTVSVMKEGVSRRITRVYKEDIYSVRG